MKKLLLENPDNMWTELDNYIYTTPLYVEGAPNPLFNSLPNSPYILNGQTSQYMGFIERYGRQPSKEDMEKIKKAKVVKI